jgi:hypothetical protein
VLRRHLYENHLDSWVLGCDKLDIPIANSKEAQRYVAEYRKRHGQGNTNGPERTDERRRFSQEAFVDAVMEFIVADDQVSNSINPWW